jgi:hypothetical protein
MRVADGNGTVGSYNLSGTAVANVGGGDLDIGDDDVQLGVGALSSGSMTVADTAVLNVARDIALGSNGGNGTYTQTGGDVNVAAAVFAGTSGNAAGLEATGTFNVTGGTLDVTLDLVSALAAAIDTDSGPGVNLVATNANGQINIGGTANVTVGRETIVGEAVFAGSVANGVLNQSGGTLTTASLTVAKAAGATGDLNLSGGILTSLSTVNNGTFDASGTGTASLGPVSGAGAVTVADTANVNADHLRQGSVAMTGGTIKITETTTGTAAGVSVIPSITLSGNARFDLTDNKLITDMAPGTATGGVYNGLQREVQRARAGTAWNQPGLTTSKPDAKTGKTTIGVSTGKQIRNLGPTQTSLWGGQTITATSTLAMYTWAGDANLDGTIDAGDYGIIDNFVQVVGADGYGNGDFNYDGFIDAGDYGIIDNNIQAQGPAFSTSGAVDGLVGVSAVPEPASLTVLGLGAFGLLARRRRAK